ncbi:MAG TPA: YIP1 family protein [Maritimibacter sp.]|nr:YIP1 family protein [Maritimibacter sp.]
MSVARDIVLAYVRPRPVFLRRVTGARDAQALALLMAACLLIFVSRGPVAQRDAIENGADFRIAMGGAMFAWLFIMPLVAYAIAGASHALARLAGGRGTWFTARVALFWALLVASPLWLLNGLTLGFIGPGIQADIVGLIALLAFLVHWVINLSIAEKGVAA